MIPQAIEIVHHQIKTGEFNFYNVHYSFDGKNTLEFEAYPVLVSLQTQEIFYQGKDDPMDLKSKFDKNHASKKFSGSMCWRGIWESRLYFTDDEYWGEELHSMSELFKQIEKYCKDCIKNQNPDYPFND